MFDRRIFHVVEQLIGPALGAQSMFYFKPPGARGQARHQDNLSLRAYPETCLAAWIAIDDVDAANGGLAVVPGSHKTELVCPEPADLTESFTSVEVPVPDGLSKVQTRMKAGDVLFFHGSVVHGSRPNTTDDRFRRSLIFHYIPEDSVEIAAFYNPLVRPDRREAVLAEALGGGPCGDYAQAEP
jgi:ectoine hydroxylase-related dioxygenase (phytanoyl-CoA dioxygenase family)